jgi:hypothetical protein
MATDPRKNRQRKKKIARRVISRQYWGGITFSEYLAQVCSDQIRKTLNSFSFSRMILGDCFMEEAEKDTGKNIREKLAYEAFAEETEEGLF